MPQTGTPMDDMMETVISAFDQFYSQQSKIKGVAGMKQNVVIAQQDNLLQLWPPA